MLISDILKGIQLKGEPPFQDVSDICTDSRKLKEGEKTVFFAYKGDVFDSHELAGELYNSGKIAVIVSEREIKGANTLLVEDGRTAFAAACANFFGNPQKKLKLIGITGTNGKTTTAYLIESIFAREGIIRIGTTGADIRKSVVSGIESIKHFPLDNTTPGAYVFFYLLSKAVQLGIKTAVVEVSSHALEQGRIAGAFFDTAVFTNLTGDHLDYHKDMESYYQTKKLLFTDKYSKIRLINLSNDYGRRLFNETGGEKYGFGLKEGTLKIINYSVEQLGTKAKLSYNGREFSLGSSLVGVHNLENIMAAVSACLSLGGSIEDAVMGVEALSYVPGRLERYENIFVDYAHTDDALKNVLIALRQICKGNIITVFGAGGDRDKTKRPRMGNIAQKYSDIVIITSDNPRTENPMDIINDIREGVSMSDNVYVEADREIAIAKAIAMSKISDAVLVAGKGHETYQIVGKEKIPFSDAEIVKKYIAAKV